MKNKEIPAMLNIKNNISVLLAEISKTRDILTKLDKHYNLFLESDYKLLGKKNTSAIVIAEVLSDFYTCVETLFIKISEFFENDLKHDQWHKDLLHKMTLDVMDIRKKVISEKTYKILSEFLKFRHFRRYYFEFKYDWDKIKYLQKKYKEVKPLIKKDLDDFSSFLKEIKK